MEKKVLKYCREKELFKPGEKVVVGISGGVDSVVLTHFLMNADYHLELVLVHINYGLRGPDSDRDEEFVRELAARWRLPCHVERVPVSFWKDNRGASKQEAGRNFRYNLFFAVAARNGAASIAVGHHRDDQAETVLARLLRGSGLAGVGGMVPRREDGIVRPLLAVTREEIIAYAKRHALQWREDLTNQAPIYQRNKIRLELLPYLQREYNIRIKENLTDFSQDLQEAMQYLQGEVMRWLSAHSDVTAENTGWPCPEYNSLPVFLRKEILRRVYTQRTGLVLSRKHAVRAFDFLNRARDGERFLLPFQVELYREGSFFRLGRRVGRPSPEKPIKVPLSGIINKEELPWRIRTFVLEKTDELEEIWRNAHANFAYLDLDKIDTGQDLRLRLWQPGDKFCPLGMGGKHKKIQDLLVDKKATPAEKENVFVLENGGRIVWVVGYRIGDEFKITRETQKILAVTLEAKS